MLQMALMSSSILECEVVELAGKHCSADATSGQRRQDPKVTLFPQIRNEVGLGTGIPPIGTKVDTFWARRW